MCKPDKEPVQSCTSTHLSVFQGQPRRPAACGSVAGPQLPHCLLACCCSATAWCAAAAAATPAGAYSGTGTRGSCLPRWSLQAAGTSTPRVSKYSRGQCQSDDSSHPRQCSHPRADGWQARTLVLLLHSLGTGAIAFPVAVGRGQPSPPVSTPFWCRSCSRWMGNHYHHPGHPSLPCPLGPAKRKQGGVNTTQHIGSAGKQLSTVQIASKRTQARALLHTMCNMSQPRVSSKAKEPGKEMNKASHKAQVHLSNPARQQKAKPERTKAKKKGGRSKTCKGSKPGNPKSRKQATPAGHCCEPPLPYAQV